MTMATANAECADEWLFHCALEARLWALRQLCHGPPRDRQRLQLAFCDGLDELIAWLGRELALRHPPCPASSPMAARRLADEHFLSLLILHRRALEVGDDQALCRELVERIAPLWVAHRRDSVVGGARIRG